MGTHPIFESDFDCLTEMKLAFFLPALFAGAVIVQNETPRQANELRGQGPLHRSKRYWPNDYRGQTCGGDVEAANRKNTIWLVAKPVPLAVVTGCRWTVRCTRRNRASSVRGERYDYDECSATCIPCNGRPNCG